MRISRTAVGFAVTVCLATVIQSDPGERAFGGPASAPTTRSFNSILRLEVCVLPVAYGCHAVGTGTTPASLLPIMLQSSDTWVVKPLLGTRIEQLVQEVRAQSIPGIWLDSVKDGDLAHLKECHDLQIPTA